MDLNTIKDLAVILRDVIFSVTALIVLIKGTTLLRRKKIGAFWSAEKVRVGFVLKDEQEEKKESVSPKKIKDKEQ